MKLLPFVLVVLLTIVSAGCCCCATGGGARRDPSGEYLTENDFRRLIGTSPEYVIETVGKPDSRSSFDNEEYWYYYNAYYDEITEKTGDVTLSFSLGTVVDVIFP